MTMALGCYNRGSPFHKLSCHTNNNTAGIQSSNNSSNIIYMSVLFFLTILNLPHQVSSTLSIDPLQKSIEVGEDAIFVCTRDDKGSPQEIVWTFDDNVVIQSSNSTANNEQNNSNGQGSNLKRVTNVNGTLKIRNATTAEKGWYTCSVVLDNGKSDKEKVELVVYLMPDYFEELLVVGIMCAVLTVFLIIGFVHKTHNDKQKKRNRNKRHTIVHIRQSTSDMDVYSVQKNRKTEMEF